MTLRISSISLLFAAFILAPFSQALAIAGSDSWYDTYSDGTNFVYYGITSDDDTIYAVGYTGAIATSTNGDDWDLQNITTESLYDVAESDYGIVAVGGGGEIYTSIDSGDSWQSQTSPTTADLLAVEFRGNKGYAAGSSGILITTIDGGQSWSTALATSSNSFHGMHVGVGESWMVGSSGTINNNGAFAGLFGAQTSGVGNNLFDVYFQDDDLTGWVVGTTGTLLATTDGGSTWSAATSGTSEHLYYIVGDDEDDDHFYIVGENILMETTDAGASFDTVTFSTLSLYQMIAGTVFEDKMYLAGLDSGGGVVVTTDTNAPTAPAIIGVDPTSPTAETDITLSWHTTSDDETSIDEYLVYLDGVYVDSPIVFLSGSYEFTGLAEGSYELGVSAKDDAGNESAISTETVVVDQSGPSITSESPTEATVDTAVSVSATVTDSLSTIDGCALYIDSVSSGSMSASGSTYSLSQTFTSTGDYSAYVACDDTVGNISVGSTWTITVSEDSGSGSGSGDSGSGDSGDSGDSDDSGDVEESADTSTLIKMQCEGGEAADDPCKAVYYYGSDEMRHAFTNEKVYFTWYEDFDDVIVVTDEFMSSISLGPNVTYHPGTKMVKFLTVNTVYVVEQGGVLRGITSEDVATDLYGSDWNTKIDDISDAFFGNYSFGDDVDDASDYDVDDALDSVSSLDDNF
ncbi:hypothetical protein HON52_02150 [Candidatus Uhrbacteria bacterium]|jgi:photosystem II stability/assembly factor-like uncharacterized protein|nr:hypothetical protein [Candidatus Uhrbacteria bacterium]